VLNLSLRGNIERLDKGIQLRPIEEVFDALTPHTLDLGFQLGKLDGGDRVHIEFVMPHLSLHRVRLQDGISLALLLHFLDENSVMLQSLFDHQFLQRYLSFLHLLLRDLLLFVWEINHESRPAAYGVPSVSEAQRHKEKNLLEAIQIK